MRTPCVLTHLGLTLPAPLSQTAEALHAIKSKGSDASSALRGGFRSLGLRLASTPRDAEPPVVLPVMLSVAAPVHPVRRRKSCES